MSYRGRLSQRGRLSVRWLIVYVPIIILTPFYSYQMAVSQHLISSLPQTSITRASCFDPQDIVFRYFMQISCLILTLIFFIIFKWVRNAAEWAHFDKPLSNFVQKMNLFSFVLPYGITVATVDGNGPVPFHTFCAMTFLLTLFWTIIEITIYMTRLRNLVPFVSKSSLRCKQFLVAQLILVAAYSLTMMMIMMFSYNLEEWDGRTYPYANILEWNTVTVCLLWVFTFYWDLPQINLVLTGPKEHIFAPTSQQDQIQRNPLTNSEVIPLNQENA